MALDTTPLPPTRRALLVVAMLLVFFGSLGFAQVLVRLKHRPMPAVLVSVRWPRGFSQEIPPPAGFSARDVDGRQASGSDGARRLYVFNFLTSASDDTAGVKAEGFRVFHAAVGVEPQLIHDSVGEPEPVALGGVEALEFIGPMSAKRGLAILRLTIVGNRCVALLYESDAGITDEAHLQEDLASFARLVKNNVSISRKFK